MLVRDAVPAFVRGLSAPVAVVALAGCASSPAPQARSIEQAITDGHGGWIELTAAGSPAVHGELIAVEADAVRVLQLGQLIVVPRATITAARLWSWDPDAGDVAGWGVAGLLSTPSHGFFVVVSAPVWLIVTTVTAAVESRSSILAYPRASWTQIAVWARFPQGMPAGLRPGDLVRQDRRAAPAPPGDPGPVAPAPP